MTRHNITITDLARELNISPSTVSRALSNHPAISHETRESGDRTGPALKL
ncbi:MAG: LacI family DNA-binding transcriptional regulator [Mangrovibacterium sp.]